MNQNDDFSDEDVSEMLYSPSSTNSGGTTGGQEDGRRAHHNALERKRRDHIKDSFLSMKQCIPSLKGERASRALILKKACDYIEGMKSQISANEKDIEQLKSQNSQLEAQIQAFETANRVLEQSLSNHKSDGVSAVPPNRRWASDRERQVTVRRAPEVKARGTSVSENCAAFNNQATMKTRISPVVPSTSLGEPKKSEIRTDENAPRGTKWAVEGSEVEVVPQNPETCEIEVSSTCTPAVPVVPLNGARSQAGFAATSNDTGEDSNNRLT